MTIYSFLLYYIIGYIISLIVATIFCYYSKDIGEFNNPNDTPLLAMIMIFWFMVIPFVILSICGTTISYGIQKILRKLPRL